MPTAEELQAKEDAQTAHYLEQWGATLGVVPYHPTTMACALMRQQVERTDVEGQAAQLNFETAIAILFGLSWQQHADWLRRCTARFRKWVAENQIDWQREDMPTCLYDWAAYYNAEVEQAPA